MKLPENYDQVLKKMMKEDLEWLKEEFQLLFEDNHDSYTKTEKHIAMKILEDVKSKSKIYNNEELVSLCSITIKNIEQAYTNLF